MMQPGPAFVRQLTHGSMPALESDSLVVQSAASGPSDPAPRVHSGELSNIAHQLDEPKSEDRSQDRPRHTRQNPAR